MDDTSPATKADLQRLERSLDQKLDKKFERVHEDISRVLDVLVNVDQRLTQKVEDHEKRIVLLEKVAA